MKHRLTGAETFELMALFDAAFDAHGEDREKAIRALVDWWERVPFMRARMALWRRRARQDALIRLLQDTDPDHLKEGGGRDGDRAA